LNCSRKSIIISLTGGLGNQLFQLAYGVAQSIEQELRLEIDQSLGNPRRNSQMIPDLLCFNLPDLVVLPENKRKIIFRKRLFSYLLSRGSTTKDGRLSYWTRLVRNISKIPFSIHFKTLADIQVATDLGFSKIITRENKSTFAIGYFQSYKWTLVPEVIKELRKISLRSSSLKFEEYISELKDSRNLFVHIRIGDYSNEPSIGVVNPKYYIEAISFMMTNYDFERIWVFSDEPFKTKDYIPKEFSSSSRLVSLDIDTQEAWELLRHGDGYVIGNSSFSWWAATLSYNENPVVVAPNPWFAILKDPLCLIPPTWFEMKSGLSE